VENYRDLPELQGGQCPYFPLLRNVRRLARGSTTAGRADTGPASGVSAKAKDRRCAGITEAPLRGERNQAPKPTGAVD
jgi:hypothetical protein